MAESAPTTAVHICNLALDRLGQRAISSIDTPTTDTEVICARHYPATRREMLRRYIFNFSKKYATLTASTTKTPAFGFSYAYPLPNDHVRLLALGDVTINDDLEPGLYDISEGYIFTNAADGGTLNIQYIYDAKDVTKFDALFVRLLALHLASNIAYKFTKLNSLIREIRDDASDVALAAAAISGQEKPPRRIERSRIIAARRYLGGRDLTRFD